MSEHGAGTGRERAAAFGALRRRVPQRTPRERCEVCGTEVSSDHAHLLEPASRQLICACNSCLITLGDQAGTPYRRVPSGARLLPGFQMTDAQWDSLLIPVGMAFFFNNSPTGRMLAFYPSPAGATESLLGLDSWEEVVRDNPVLGAMKSDVEALLVNRLNNAQEYYLAPIDRCYELVGLIRTHWRGLSGGTEVWEEIGTFFDTLKQQASRPHEQSRA